MKSDETHANEKIRSLAYLHGVHLMNIGARIRPTTTEAEENRLRVEYDAGHITLKDMQDDINEYLSMR